MEVRLDASNADAGLLTPDTFVAIRLGDMRQQGRLKSGRSFTFAELPEGRGCHARLEIFQRIGVGDVRLEEVGDTGVELDIPCSFGSEERNLCMRLFTQNAVKVAPFDKKIRSERTKKRLHDDQQYLTEHQLEDLLSDAVKEVIRSKPTDPHAFLSKRMVRSVSDSVLKPLHPRPLSASEQKRPPSASQKLPPIDKEVLSEPAQKVVAPDPPPLPPPPPVDVKPEEEKEAPMESKSAPPEPPPPPVDVKPEEEEAPMESKSAPPEVPTTELTEEVFAGSTVLPVVNTTGFIVGDPILIESSAGVEINKIKGFSSIQLARPLKLTHPPGTTIKTAPPDHPLSKELPVESIVTAEVLEQSEKLGSLSDLSEEERAANLSAMDNLSAGEKSALLEAPGAAKSLMAGGGADELSVLIGGKSSQEIARCKSLWAKLKSGCQISFEDLMGVDLKYTDAAGNNALHLMQTPEQAEVLLKDETGKELAESRNHNGESAVASVMQHCSGSADGAPMLKMFADNTWNALNEARMEGGVQLTDDMKDICAPAVSWPEVREMLLSPGLDKFLDRMTCLSNKMQEARPGMKANDYAGFWTEALLEHCFGSLATSGETLEHTEQSKERLLDVFKAMEMLLLACSEPESMGADAGKVEKIVKALLSATRGPDCPPFDPREPYREKFIALIREIQSTTAGMLNEVYDDALREEPDAVHEVGEFPKDELHHVETKGAVVRRAKSRLRMDSPVVVDDQFAAQPLETPEWVLGQYLNGEAWDGLQRSGVIEMPTDILKISRQGGAVDAGAMTEDRLRFSRLHAAFLRGYCNDRQAILAKKFRELLELEGDPSDGPCQAAGGSTVVFFRTRSEAKGVDRILEKMEEAIEEEHLSEESRAILEVEDHDQHEKQVASRELLTPACYVCDINGAEVVVDTFTDLAAIYKSIRSKTLLDGDHQVVRTKNGFSSKIPKAKIAAQGGYRDLKVFVNTKVDGIPLAGELQLHVRGYYDLKGVMHLPYECSRGSFDHPHLASLWKKKTVKAAVLAVAVAQPEPVPQAPAKSLSVFEKPSVGTWYTKRLPQKEISTVAVQIPPEAPESILSFFEKPSVGTWYTERLPQREKPEAPAEVLYKDYSQCSYSLKPSVGTWLTLGPIAPFTDQELAAFAEQEAAFPEQEPKDPWFTQPSVASWLQKLPPEVERPWFYTDPTEFGECADYVSRLQNLLAEKEKELEEMRKRVEVAEPKP